MFICTLLTRVLLLAVLLKILPDFHSEDVRADGIAQQYQIDASIQYKLLLSSSEDIVLTKNIIAVPEYDARNCQLDVCVTI
jgi:hypothetical protein